MKKKLLIIPFLSFSAFCHSENCSKIEDNASRLTCYDSLFKKGTSDKSSNKESKWERKVITDKMENTEKEIASILSDNSVSLDFPYQGLQKATLTIIGENGNDSLLFSLEKGQLLCESNCYLRIKIDDKSPYTFSGKKAPDGNTTYTFNTLSSRQLKDIKNATKILIQPTIYRNGSPIFEFNVENNPYVGYFKFAIDELELMLKNNDKPELIEKSRITYKSFKQCIDGIYNYWRYKDMKKGDWKLEGYDYYQYINYLEEKSKDKIVIIDYYEDRVSKEICDKKNKFFGKVFYSYKH